VDRDENGQMDVAV